MLINVIIFVSVLGLFILSAFVFGNAERKRLLTRIDRLKNRKVTVPKTVHEMSLRRRNDEVKKGLIFWLMKPLPNIKKLGDRLERAGHTISPRQYLLRRLLTILLIMFAISSIFHKSVLLGLFLGIIIGLWLPLKLLQFSINRQAKAFRSVFPDAIDLIVRGLRSGLPVSESLVLVSHEVPQPVSGVFANIVNTMKLGVPLEKALQETAKKLDMTEFNFFTTSIILQRETGGNLSEVLNNLSEVLRGRYLMRMKIKAISSEARASAYIVGSLPFLVLIAILVFSPAYIEPLYSDYHGNICAGIAIFMMSFGLWVMHRMTKFEI